MTTTLPPALAADAEEFEDWLVGCNLSPTTINKRLLVVRAVLTEWGTWHVRPSDVSAFLRRHTGWTATTYYFHLRSMFGWALETGRVEVDPTAKVRSPAKPNPTPRPLPPEAMRQALATATGELRAYLLLAYLAGFRCHEIAKMHGRDIDAQTISVVGKGGQGARLPVHPDLWALAQDYPRDGYWFPPAFGKSVHVHPSVVSTRVRAHLRGLGVTSGSIHRVRASYATDMLNDGTNVRLVQALMRHRSLASTEHYLGVSDDGLRNAIHGLRTA